MQENISTGIELLDKQIKGYPIDGITVIYGPSNSGKTNLALIASKKIIENRKKILILNTEGEIIIDRIKQLFKNINDFLFLKIKTFEQQDKIINELCTKKIDSIGLIIFDSSNKILRSEINIDNKRKYYEQLKKLKKISRERKIPIIMTAQVYHSCDIEEEKMFAGDVIKEHSDCIIELKIIEKLRKIKIKKHNQINGEKEFYFRIEEKEIKGFTLQ